MENTVHNLLGKLRPLVGADGWDYCVVWKHNGDQRFVKWLGCCCGGLAEEMTIYNNGGSEEFCFTGGATVAPNCRDSMFHHPGTTSCQLLSLLPCSIPLDSGIHAETLLSNQTTWLNFSTCGSELISLLETPCTRVLVPVPGGIVELFVTRHVSEDQNVVDFVMGQCNLTGMNMVAADEIESKIYGSKEEMKFSYDDQTRLDFLPQLSDYNGQYDLELKNDYHALGFLSENKQIGMNPFDVAADQEEFPTGMEPLHDSMGTGTAASGADMIHPECSGPSLLVKEQPINDKETFSHEINGRLDSGSDCSDQIDDEDDAKFKKKSGKGSQAKNLMAERRRRKKLNDRLYALRSLVPKISKLDRASILGDAINYVKELQNEEKKLQEELEENSDDNEDGSNRQSFNAHGDVLHKGFRTGARSPSLKQDLDPENSNDKGQEMEPQVDVAMVDGKEFVVKVICEYKPGGFTRLVEALDTLGLEVTNVSTTRFLGLVSNLFKVERKDSEMVQVEHVKESLMEITRNTSRGWHNHDHDHDQMDNGVDQYQQHYDKTHHHQINQEMSPHHHHHHHHHIEHYHNQV